MSRILSATVVAAAFNARYPGIGTLPSISASEGTLDQVQAMAVRGYSAPSSKLVWVKALSNFYVSGEIAFAGDYVEVPEDDARGLFRNDQATAATQQEVDTAALGSKTKVSS